MRVWDEVAGQDIGNFALVRAAIPPHPFIEKFSNGNYSS